jgi:hypothetical protein
MNFLLKLKEKQIKDNSNDFNKLLNDKNSIFKLISNRSKIVIYFLKSMRFC